MLKLLGAMLVMASCTAAGVLAAEEKKKRLQSLRELKRFFIALQGEIRYGGTPLREAIEIAAGGSEAFGDTRGRGNLYPIFFKIAEKMEQKTAGGFLGLWQEELTKGSKKAGLKPEDMERLFRAGETLGYLDRETQINCLELYLSEVSGDIAAEETGLGEKSRLCRWLGALLGLFISILLI